MRLIPFGFRFDYACQSNEQTYAIFFRQAGRPNRQGFPYSTDSVATHDLNETRCSKVTNFFRVVVLRRGRCLFAFLSTDCCGEEGDTIRETCQELLNGRSRNRRGSRSNGRLSTQSRHRLGRGPDGLVVVFDPLVERETPLFFTSCSIRTKSRDFDIVEKPTGIIAMVAVQELDARNLVDFGQPQNERVVGTSFEIVGFVVQQKERKHMRSSGDHEIHLGVGSGVIDISRVDRDLVLKHRKTSLRGYGRAKEDSAFGSVAELRYLGVRLVIEASVSLRRVDPAVAGKVPALFGMDVFHRNPLQKPSGVSP